VRAARGRRPALTVIALISTLSLGALALAGCDTSAADEDPTPVQTWKITPADPSFAPPEGETPEAETPEATAASETPSAGAGEGTTITIIGVSSTFDEEELEAPAGPITIVFDNQDSGIVHNVRFFDGDDADADVVGETELEIGPIEQTLDMDLDEGSYFFQCDAHPATMTGTLVVE
jgi:plastocyanin